MRELSLKIRRAQNALYARRSYWKHRTTRLAANRLYHQAHRLEIAKTRRKWRACHPEKVKIYQRKSDKKYRSLHDVRAQQREIYWKNPERARNQKRVQRYKQKYGKDAFWVRLAALFLYGEISLKEAHILAAKQDQQTVFSLKIHPHRLRKDHEPTTVEA